MWSLFAGAVLLAQVYAAQAEGLRWAWLGALQSTGVRIKCKYSLAPSAAKLDIHPELYLNRLGAKPQSSTEVHLANDAKEEQAEPVLPNYTYAIPSANAQSRTYIADFWVKDFLEPRSRYEYEIFLRSGESVWVVRGEFRTPAPEGAAMNFSFAFASCAQTGSNSRVFAAVRRHDPLLFVHMGDMHYGNLAVNSTKAYHELYDTVFASPNQARLFRNLPVAYMFDDHDYGPNNSDENSPGRDAAITAYLEAVPSYKLARYSEAGEAEGPSPSRPPSIYHAFTVGRVRFILTDLRSSRAPLRTILGKEQLEWFEHELVWSSKHHDFVFWVNTIPWIVDSDKWGSFAVEQGRIVDVVRNHTLNNVYMLCGDAHMLAYDDGSNSPGALPVFHAAALDAKPTSKGGPYSHGIHPGGGQYGIMRVNYADGGGKPCLVFSGMRMASTGTAAEVLRINTCEPSDSAPPRLYRPSPFLVRKVWKTMKKGLPLELMLYVDSMTESLYMKVQNWGIALTCILASVLVMRLSTAKSASSRRSS